MDASPKNRVSPSGANRRRGEDRRQRPSLLADWRWAYRGRRRTVRRSHEADSVHLDWHHPRLLLVCIGILVLSGADATFTLTLLHLGAAEEANPFMRFFIEHDTQTFVNVKTFLTGAALVFMVACAKLPFLRTVRVERIIHGVLGLYAVLVGYELFLLKLAMGS